jgi:Putative member of DMT superfamily (DUF486)
MNWAAITPILLLCGSNVFMTFAWYGQLRYPNTPLWILVLVGWGIALFEYCLAVPANHIGYLLDDVSGRGAALEPRRRVRLPRARRLLRVSQMVTPKFSRPC